MKNRPTVDIINNTFPYISHAFLHFADCGHDVILRQRLQRIPKHSTPGTRFSKKTFNHFMTVKIRHIICNNIIFAVCFDFHHFAMCDSLCDNKN